MCRREQKAERSRSTDHEVGIIAMQPAGRASIFCSLREVGRARARARLDLLLRGARVVTRVFVYLIISRHTFRYPLRKSLSVQSRRVRKVAGVRLKKKNAVRSVYVCVYVGKEGRFERRRTK